MPDQLTRILGVMASKNLAVYEPANQTRAALLYWRLPEEWAEVLYEWVRKPPPPFFFLPPRSRLCGLTQFPAPWRGGFGR